MMCLFPSCGKASRMASAMWQCCDSASLEGGVRQLAYADSFSVAMHCRCYHMGVRKCGEQGPTVINDQRVREVWFLNEWMLSINDVLGLLQVICLKVELSKSRFCIFKKKIRTSLIATSSGKRWERQTDHFNGSQGLDISLGRMLPTVSPFLLKSHLGQKRLRFCGN